MVISRRPAVSHGGTHSALLRSALLPSPSSSLSRELVSGRHLPLSEAVGWPRPPGLNFSQARLTFFVRSLYMMSARKQVRKWAVMRSSRRRKTGRAVEVVNDSNYGLFPHIFTTVFIVSPQISQIIEFFHKKPWVINLKALNLFNLIQKYSIYAP